MNDLDRLRVRLLEKTTSINRSVQRDLGRMIHTLKQAKQNKGITLNETENLDQELNYLNEVDEEINKSRRHLEKAVGLIEELNSLKEGNSNE